MSLQMQANNSHPLVFHMVHIRCSVDIDGVNSADTKGEGLQSGLSIAELCSSN